MSEYVPLVDPAALAVSTRSAYAAATAEQLRQLLAPHLQRARNTRIQTTLNGRTELAFVLTSLLVPDEVAAIREGLRAGRYEEAYAYRDAGEYPGTRRQPAWVFGPADLRPADAVPWHLKAAGGAAVLMVSCAAAAYVTHATRYV